MSLTSGKDSVSMFSRIRTRASQALRRANENETAPDIPTWPLSPFTRYAETECTQIHMMLSMVLSTRQGF